MGSCETCNLRIKSERRVYPHLFTIDNLLNLQPVVFVCQMARAHAGPARPMTTITSAPTTCNTSLLLDLSAFSDHEPCFVAALVAQALCSASALYLYCADLDGVELMGDV